MGYATRDFGIALFIFIAWAAIRLGSQLPALTFASTSSSRRRPMTERLRRKPEADQLRRRVSELRELVREELRHEAPTEQVLQAMGDEYRLLRRDDDGFEVEVRLRGQEETQQVRVRYVDLEDNLMRQFGDEMRRPQKVGRD